MITAVSQLSIILTVKDSDLVIEEYPEIEAWSYKGYELTFALLLVLN